jgi:hypothetical protein
LITACANMGDPPGGPPDTTPPAVLAARPESGAVVPGVKGAAVVQFDAVIDEMASGGGSTAGGAIAGLGRYVLLSPVAGEVKVGWHRSSISVEPKEGWKPGRIYHLQLLAGIADLRRNIRKQSQSFIFSTGPAIPSANLSGATVLWIEQRALTQGLIWAKHLPDTVGYLALTDSAGRFRIDAVPPGRYVVYAIQDQNGNRRRDPREAYDSALVTADTGSAPERSATLWAFVHDTLGPRGRGAEPIDSLAFRVNFTLPLDPASRLDTSRVRLVALPDSTPVPVTAVLSQAKYDSLVARERAVTDSLKRAADTTHRDTSARARPPGARGDTIGGRGAPPSAAGQRAPAAARGTPSPAADTSALRKLLSQRPIPTDRIVIRVGKPLVPNTRYHILVRGLRNLNGVIGDAQAVLTVPKPPPPPRPKPAARDTTRAPRDTAP